MPLGEGGDKSIIWPFFHLTKCLLLTTLSCCQNGLGSWFFFFLNTNPPPCEKKPESYCHTKVTKSLHSTVMPACRKHPNNICIVPAKALSLHIYKEASFYKQGCHVSCSCAINSSLSQSYLPSETCLTVHLLGRKISPAQLHQIAAKEQKMGWGGRLSCFHSCGLSSKTYWHTAGHARCAFL